MKCPNKITYLQKNLHFALTLALIYFLLHYGLEKILRIQFYQPAGNTLHTEVGQLHKDILFWSTMGSSNFYSRSTGFIELIVGMLLIFNRTRFLGYICSCGIFMHIFLINIGFDISVKYFSMLLLLSSVLGLIHYKAKLTAIFGLPKPTQIEEYQYSARRMGIFILFITIELVAQFAFLAPREMSQSFNVRNQQETNAIEFAPLKRLHIHPENFLIFESTEGKFTRYPMDHTKSQIVINNHKLPFRITAEGFYINNQKIADLIPINLQKLPLLKDETHLFLENFR